MAPRGPRLAAALTFLAAALYTGRWLAEFFADRWWAATVAPEAASTLARQALARLGLDALGITLALLWFGLNARLLLAATADLGPRERGGNAAIRAALQSSQAWFWASVAVLLLALLAGAGPGQWADSIVLATAGVRFGFEDPALGLDAGVLAGQLPLWLRCQAFVTVLLLVALAVSGAVHLLTGAARVGRGRVAITDRARGHLGMLLALLAVLLAASRVLAPYELAAGLPFPVVPSVVHVHRAAGLVLAGIAMAAAGVSVLWALRPAHAMMAGTWLAFLFALVAAEVLLPADRPDPRDPVSAEDLAVFEAAAYGLRPSAAPAPEVRPAIAWDQAALARLRPDTSVAGTVVPAIWQAGGADRTGWLVLVPGGPAAGVTAYLVPGDTLGPGGRPLYADRAGGFDMTARGVATLPGLAVRPGAPSLASGNGVGVPVGSLPRRAALAWALQAPRLLAAASGSRVNWHLAPEARLRRLAPWAVWSGSRAVLDGERLLWIVDGYSVSDGFPVARRRPWLGQRVSYARAGFVGIVTADSGTVAIHLRPGADPISLAWARAWPRLVRSTQGLPPTVRALLGYPADLLPLQAELLVSRGRGERDPGTPSLVTRRGVVAGPGQSGAVAIPLEAARTGVLAGIATGIQVDGEDRLHLAVLDTAAAIDAPDVLERRWQRLPLFGAIRDSLVEAGADTMPGAVRYAVAPAGGAVAWQPLWAADPEGGVRLAAVGVARGGRLGAGRTLAEAWQSLEGNGGAPPGEPALILEEARRWAREADSALRQGDLGGFAKAFAALRELLDGTASRPP